jgi:putative phosphoribosyl transferase
MRTSRILQNESADQGAHYLAQQLSEHTSSSAVIVAASTAAMEMAALLANQLNLPLEIIPSRVIRHPGNPSKLIGSVTVDEFDIDNDLQNIPQNYLSHQLLLTQASVRKDYESYYSHVSPTSFRNKTIILVDVVIDTAHPVVASLKSIRKQQPREIIVASLYMSADATHRIGAMADQLTFFEVTNNAPNNPNNTGRKEREYAVERLNQFRDEHALV